MKLESLNNWNAYLHLERYVNNPKYSVHAMYSEVEVDEETLYRRRLVDLHKKKRKLEKEIIAEELKQNSRAFEHYVAILAQYTKVTAQRIVNSSLEESLRTLNCCYTL